MRLEKAHAGIAAMPTVKNELMTRKQVAALLQVHSNTVTRYEIAGKLPVVRLGPFSVRYRRSDVLQLIQDSITTKATA
jgi:excisionase family DNA binding protein